MIEKDKVKQLIQKGFDLKLLSLELDIPMNELVKYQNEIEREQKRKSKHAPKSKIEQMRKKYEKLLKTNNGNITSLERVPTVQEIEAIEKAIKKMEIALQKMKDSQRQEDKKKNAAEMVSIIRKIENYPLSIEQLKEIKGLMHDSELGKLSFNAVESKQFNSIKMAKELVVKKIVEVVDIKLSQATSLEEIKQLEQHLDPSIRRNYIMIFNKIMLKISSRKSQIQTQKAIENVKNNLPPEIVKIMKDISNGELENEEANQIILQEAERRMKNKPKSIFSLTLEQEKSQIVRQIMMGLSEDGKRYSIVDPDKSLADLQKIDGIDLGKALDIVARNLITIKDYEQAKNLCAKFSKHETEDLKRRSWDLRTKIKIAEISDMVIKALNKRGSLEEENMCFDLIEKGIRSSGINHTSIILGKSENGSKNITLADIWPEKEEIQK